MKSKALVVLSFILISPLSFAVSRDSLKQWQEIDIFADKLDTYSAPFSQCKIFVYWTDYDRDGHGRNVEERMITEDNHSLQDCLDLANSNHEKAKKDFGKRYLYTTYHFESDQGENVDGKLIP